MRIRNLRMAAAVGLLLAMTGCVGGDPLPTLPPTPTETPIFASEEEALAAAEDAYAAYGSMADQIAREAGAEPERIESFVTSDRLTEELRGFANLSRNGLRVVGDSRFETIELQRAESVDGEFLVVFYACLNIAETTVYDRDGNDVTPENRELRTVLEVVMRTSEGQLPLLLESDEQWPELSC